MNTLAITLVDLMLIGSGMFLGWQWRSARLYNEDSHR